MVDSNKIGQFISELRKSKNLSQEKFGELLGVERVSISKWERGVTLPRYDMLLKLSSMFDVTVNEILYGEWINKQNEEKINEVSANLYKSNHKVKKVVIALVFVLLLIIALFGLYYFFNSYKTIEAYTVSGNSDSVIINGGIFVKTRGKIYFSINELEFKKEVNIKKMTLYYKEIENLIYSGDGTSILISEYYGENEYFQTKYLNDITENLYLHIDYDNDESEEIKLHFTQDYINDILLFKKVKSVAEESNFKVKAVSPELKYLMNIIEENFDRVDDTYYHYETIDDLDYIASYIPNTNTITLNVSEKDGTILEEWNFDINGKVLLYQLFDNQNIVYDFEYKNDKMQCLTGPCQNAEEKNDFFWSYLYEIKQEI